MRRLRPGVARAARGWSAAGRGSRGVEVSVSEPGAQRLLRVQLAGADGAVLRVALELHGADRIELPVEITVQQALGEYSRTVLITNHMTGLGGNASPSGGLRNR